ncbi:MAG: type II toxin-antitoxin system RelE/ParE family toxin [Mongoliitalea sp.]
MAYNIRISDEAESDLLHSYRWYEEQKEGLGEDFLVVIDAGLQTISDNPMIFQIRYKKKVRAFVVDRFPYLILYIINGNDLDIISVFNTSQNPKKWKKRVSRS